MKIKNMQDAEFLLNSWRRSLVEVIEEQEKLDNLMDFLDEKSINLFEARKALEIGFALKNCLVEEKATNQDLFDTLEEIDSDFWFFIEKIKIAERDFIKAE